MSVAAGALFVVDRISRKGGAETYLSAVARDLDARSGRCEVLFGHADPTGAGAWRDATTRLEALARREAAPPDGADAAALRRTLATFRGSAVVVQNVMSPALLHVLAADERALHVVQDHRMFCPARGKVFPDRAPCSEPEGPACDRCFAGEHGLDEPRRDAMRALVAERRAAALHFRRTVVLSEYMRRELVAAGWPADAVMVVPPAAPAREALRPASAPAAIAVVGRIAWAKGSVHLVEALAGAGLRVPVTFVGSGPAEGDLATAARRAGLDDLVRITGWMDGAAVARELGQVRAVVMPSLWAEPFGIAGLEAAAAALPVVAHAVGGIPEWVADGRTGLLAPPGDGGALAARIGEILRDPRLAETLGAAARTDVRERFSGDRFAAAWRQLLGS